MLEDKKSETPYASFMNSVSDEQCFLCRFNNKRKTWHCSREAIWSGENPCLKSQEHICPIAREDDSSLEI